MEYAVQLNDFLLEGKAMVMRTKPFADALAAEPSRADILPRTLDLSYQLFRYVQGNARLLGLDRLKEPSDLMEYLLDRARSGVVSLTPSQILLLAKAVAFLDRAMPQILIDKNDARLDESATALVDALRDSLQDSSAASMGTAKACSEIEPSMRESLLRETLGMLDVAEGEFVLWDFIAVDGARVAELVRMLHQLKRNFALIEFSALERLSEALESTLQRFIGGDFFQTEYPERVFIRCIDAMRTCLAESVSGLAPEVPGLNDHLAALQGLIRQPIGTLLIEAGLVDATIVDNALQVQRERAGTEPRRLGEVLVDMGEVTQEQVERILESQQRKRSRAEQAEQALTVSFEPMRAQPPDPAWDTVQVECGKLVRMIELIEQLAGGEQSATPMTELRNLADSCRRDVLGAFSARLHRLVHDLAVEQGKKVYFSVHGLEETLGARDMQLLFSPLWSLLQNALKHGLEDAVSRQAAGKERGGQLSLLALRQGDQTWISVEDDGRGLDRRAMLEAAIARGVMSPVEGEAMTSREIVRLLLQPTSGDPGGQIGMHASGLAAVNQVVHQMRGSIDMLSRPGKGTRITLKLPTRG